MNDLRIEMRFKNAALYRAICDKCMALARELNEHRGPLALIRAASERCGVSRDTISDFLNLRRSPRSISGTYKPAAVRIAEGLDATPEELFPESVYAVALPRCVVREIESKRILSLQEARRMKLLPAVASLDDDGSSSGLIETLPTIIDRLSPRKQMVIRRRFGFDGPPETYSDLAEDLDVSSERVRQVEQQALRELKKELSPRVRLKHVG